MKDLVTLLLAAGKGTRMRTSSPKALFPICGMPILDRALEVHAKLEPSNIYIVVGHKGNELIKHIRSSTKIDDTAVSHIEQTPQLGTGHAVQIALPEIPESVETILIAPADVPLLRFTELKTLCEYHKETKAELTFLSTAHPVPASLGRVVRDNNGKLQSITEAVDCSNKQLEIKEVNSGIYLASRKFLEEAISSLSTNNAQGELYLTDIISWGVQNSRSVEVCKVQSWQHLAGGNTISELAKLEKIRRREIAESHMANGVSFENFESIYIDEEIKIAADCFIGANARLKGKTIISSGTKIEGDCLIEDSKIGHNSTIRLGSYIQSSVIHNDVSVGPYAHIRPGSELKDEVKIGNFVETKKAILEKGVKAGHLSYLGDSHIGEETNIGAGTITCNYNGKNKHQTIIEKNVFIGSNTSLVAPVKIGENATIGAGSVITKNVCKDSLGISRAEQKEVPNWAKRQKQSSKNNSN